jgi:hypothetical protein
MGSNFDAPNHPQSPRAADRDIERRRSPRCNAYVPVFVYGRTATQDPFHEEAYSAVVSDRGGLLIMTTTVPIGERLLLTNKNTEIDQECRVTGIGRRDGPSIEIAVDFTAEVPEFWRITAPPRRASVLPAVEPCKKAL